MVLKGQECLLTRDLILTSTLRIGGCRIYYEIKYLYDIYSHDCLPKSYTGEIRKDWCKGGINEKILSVISSSGLAKFKKILQETTKF